VVSIVAFKCGLKYTLAITWEGRKYRVTKPVFISTIDTRTGPAQEKCAMRFINGEREEATMGQRSGTEYEDAVFVQLVSFISHVSALV